VSTQIAASRRENLKGDVWTLWLDIAIWSLSHKGKLDFSILPIDVICFMGTKTSHFCLYHCHFHNVSKLTCYAARRNIVRNVIVLCTLFNLFSVNGCASIACRCWSFLLLKQSHISPFSFVSMLFPLRFEHVPTEWWYMRLF
jgi:hypothetical protein